MDDNDLDSVRHKPDFKDILRAVLKHQMKYLVEQLSKYGGDEVLVLATNLSGGVVSHLGSAATRGFLDNRDDIKSQFLGHCIRNNLQERTESTVLGSVNSSLTASQTDIPHTQQYIAAGSTHGCVVQPEIAVDSSSTFTRTLPAIRTKTVEFNTQPNNNIKTPPKFGLHYMQSQLEQMGQRVCNNQFTKAPMAATSCIVKPRTGMKRSCETVTSENSSRRKIVHNDGSDLGCKETTTPTSNERSSVHKDDNKLTLDDKDDSIFDDYVMGQFDATEKESEVPDNDPVPDYLDQVQPLNSEDADLEQALTGPFSRKSYNFSYKFEVMQYAENYGIPNAAKVYNLPDSTLRQWIKQKEKLRSVGENNMSMLRNRRMRKGRWPELEKHVENFLHERTVSGKVITNRVIQVAAKNIAEQLGLEDFNASNGWIAKFKRRKCSEKNYSEQQEMSKDYDGPVA